MNWSIGSRYEIHNYAFLYEIEPPWLVVRGSVVCKAKEPSPPGNSGSRTRFSYDDLRFYVIRDKRLTLLQSSARERLSAAGNTLLRIPISALPRSEPPRSAVP